MVAFISAHNKAIRVELVRVGMDWCFLHGYQVLDLVADGLWQGQGDPQTLQSHGRLGKEPQDFKNMKADLQTPNVIAAVEILGRVVATRHGQSLVI